MVLGFLGAFCAKTKGGRGIGIYLFVMFFLRHFWRSKSGREWLKGEIELRLNHISHSGTIF